MEEAVKEKHRCFMLCKVGESQAAAYHKAKHASKFAVYQAKSEPEKVALKKIDPRSCQTGVGSNAIFCGGCLCWIHKKCSGIKGPLWPYSDFRCAGCLETARLLMEEVREVKVDEKLEGVPEFCYLGVMLSAGDGCELAACGHALQMCLGQVPPTSPSSHQPQSAASDYRLNA